MKIMTKLESTQILSIFFNSQFYPIARTIVGGYNYLQNNLSQSHKVVYKILTLQCPRILSWCNSRMSRTISAQLLHKQGTPLCTSDRKTKTQD